MAALNFVDRSSSPPPIEPPSPSTVEASPIDTNPRGTFSVGPPARRNFAADPSGDDDQYGAIHTPANKIIVPPLPDQPSSKTATVTPAEPQQQQFPSSFAQNKRAQERAAAAQLAQQAQHQALHQPGRPAGAASKNKKKKVWQDSDEEEDEEDEEDESSEDEKPSSGPSSRPQSQPGVPPSSQSYSSLAPPPSRPHSMAIPTQQNGSARPASHSPGNRSPARSPNRQAYLESGPGSHHQATNSLHHAPSRENFNASEMPPPSDPNRKPALNPHGLLATGMIEREERSARALENVARDSGGTLVSLPTKPPPPQTGLVGAITSHEREKERTGGVGKALTEQQRERKLAEQRQKQLDELQKRQLEEQQRQMAAMYQQQMQMAQFGGAGFNPMMQGGMNPMGMGSMGSMGFAGANPWMMGGGPMSGMGGFGSFPSMQSFSPGSQMGGTSPGLQPQTTGGSMDQVTLQSSRVE